MQFRLWRVAAFVSSPIHLFKFFVNILFTWVNKSDADDSGGGGDDDDEIISSNRYMIECIK